jgi:hypothetical protein
MATGVLTFEAVDLPFCCWLHEHSSRVRRSLIAPVLILNVLTNIVTG